LSVADETKYFHNATRFSQLHDLERLMVLQGCRPEELLSVEVSHIDLSTGTLRITEGKSNAAKRKLKLRQESLEILARLLREAKGRWVLCSERDAKRSCRSQPARTGTKRCARRPAFLA
jgi:integrase